MSDETVNETAQVEGPETATQNEDALPEWAREKLSKAYNEAAKYRVQAKEALDKARQEVSAEFEKQLAQLSDEKAAVAADLENVRLEHMRLKAALSVGIPGESASEFADLLKGNSEDEIRARAEKVKELFGVSSKPARAVDPTQGLGEGDVVANTPGAMLAQFVRNSK